MYEMTRWLRLFIARLRWVRVGPNHWIYYRGGASIEHRSGRYYPRVRGCVWEPPSMSSLSMARVVAEARMGF